MRNKSKPGGKKRVEHPGRVFQVGSSLDQELEYVSEGQYEDGQVYDLYLGRISRQPVVKSRSSGKHFVLPWAEIIRLAIAEGLNRKS